MSAEPPADDAPQRLLLPLAQLYRRARNARNAFERHLAAYLLWEAGLKLLASVAIVEYAERGPAAPELAERLKNLARPALGHWWELARLLTAALADAGDADFVRLRDLLLGRPRGDCPRAAGLDAVLRELQEGKAGARSTVQLAELFHRLVALRNEEIGHGAVGAKPASHYERTAPAMLAGVSEVLGRVDVLAGRRLIHVSDVRLLTSGAWLVERYDLSGPEARRLESLEVAASEAAQLPRPGRLYLHRPDPAAPWRPLHPLLTYDAETERVFFLNARVRQRRADYLCYTTGEVVRRDELGQDQRELLARALGAPVDEAAVEAWAERGKAEDSPPSPLKGEGPGVRGEPRTVGEFELISRLGQGGMGVVYRAWQPSLGRQVALKCLMRVGDPKAEARFGREIRALGRVEHPNLVKVFTSGADGDRWFYAMELVEGADLASVWGRLAGGDTPEVGEAEWTAAVSTAWEEQRRRERPLSDDGPPAEAAPEAAAPASGASPRGGRGYIARAVEAVRQAAEAAHALHEAGVVHRDIKPGNILLEAGDGRAVLMDLGLAQLADEAEGRLTRTRQFVGTLRYASPEQVLAAAKPDRRADVYSLGATLWELLTLRPLFGAGEQTPTPELMLTIQTTDPERPRKVNPRVPADLEAIVMRCLEKDRGRRYATAAELAEDLGRWQRGEPVRARPVGGWERALKWMRRHPQQTALYGLLLAALVLGLGGGGATWLWLRAEGARSEAERAKGDAEAARVRAETAEGEARTAKRRLTQYAYADRVYLAQSEWDAGQVQHARDLLLEAGDLQEELTPGQRPWEWDYLNRVFHPELAVLQGHTESVDSVAFSPDGRRLATAGSLDNTVRLWDAEACKPIAVLQDHADIVECVAFSPDGRRLATAGWDGTPRLWDADSGKSLAVLKGHTDRAVSVAFSPDGRRLATASWDRTTRLWDADSGQPLAVLQGHTGMVEFVAFSPDGSRLATASADKTARLWDAGSGKPITVFQGHTNWDSSVAFSPDGNRLATASGDHTARLWDAESGKPLAVLRGHTWYVVSVCFSPDGRRLATAGWDGTARVWDAETGQPLAVMQGHMRNVECVAFSPDGRRLASAGEEKTARLWDAETGQPLAVLQGHTGEVSCVAFSPDGRRLATASKDGTVRLWIARESPEELSKRVEAQHQAWLEQQADAAEKAGNWFAAAFFLRQFILQRPDDADLKERLRVAETKLGK